MDETKRQINGRLDTTICGECGCNEAIFTHSSAHYDEPRSTFHRFINGSSYPIRIPHCYECGADLRPLA